MNAAVGSTTLAEVIARYRFAYPMTASASGAAPHAVAVSAALQENGDLVVRGIGRRTRDNALEQPAVGLVWPPLSESDCSLVVDGQAVVSGELMHSIPTRAVLHRPAPPQQPAAVGDCASDCIEPSLGRGAGRR